MKKQIENDKTIFELVYEMHVQSLIIKEYKSTHNLLLSINTTLTDQMATSAVNAINQHNRIRANKRREINNKLNKLLST